ncbi:MAG: hypothetical protein J5944_02340, partial [Lentisphaeria bacterium]|nr:hypothetical protein [Lentisphaeria bacterium]
LGLIKRTNLWWFDMWGEFYQGEAVMDTQKRIREIWTEYAGTPAKDVCKIALIVDPDSTYYLNQDHPDIPEINREIRNKVNLVGAPFEVYSFNDIPKIKNFKRYKLVIFTSLFHLTPEKKSILRKHVLKDGRTVLWLGPAGIIDNETYDPENCRKLTGHAVTEKNFAPKQMKNWNSVLVRDYRKVTPAVLKTMAEQAGVLLYTKREWPVFAEGKLLAVHTAQGGREEIRVPVKTGTATELFSGKTYRIANGKFQYRFQKPDTALFAIL